MLGVTEDGHSGALKKLKITLGCLGCYRLTEDAWGGVSLKTLEVEVTVGGQCHCRCSESMRRLRVEVTSGQGHCKNSGPLGTLGAVVDIHGQGSCSAQEHQAGSTR